MPSINILGERMPPMACHSPELTLYLVTNPEWDKDSMYDRYDSFVVSAEEPVKVPRIILEQYGTRNCYNGKLWDANIFPDDYLYPEGWKDPMTWEYQDIGRSRVPAGVILGSFNAA